MKIIATLFFSVFFLFNSVRTNAQAASTVLTNTGVIEMHKSGLGADVILTSIESSVCKFNVTSTGLVALKKAGVDDQVIKAMIEKQSGKATAADGITASTSSGLTSKETGRKKAEKPQALSLINHVYYSPGASAAKPLEKLVAGIRTKQGAFGGSVLFQVDGAKSDMRIEKGGVVAFAINTGGETAPEVVLYRLKVVKGKREATTMKANSFSGMKTGEDVVTLDISKLGNGTYKIVPSKTLEPGEYFFTGKPSQGSTSAEAFGFGID